MLCVRYINLEYSVFGGGEKGEMRSVRGVLLVCVHVCMCVCVWERERKADRERERGSGERGSKGNPLSNWWF